MPNSTFHFKQFSIEQDRCAMKVGTDGVLLGAWAGKNQDPKRILDVGTGTGLIALMMAQRFPESKITAIEMDPEAARQAEENIGHSPFENRIDVVQTDFFKWKSPAQYDLIVCNPPFFEHAHPAKSEERMLARHGIHFSIRDFISAVSQFAAANGRLALILPVAVFGEIKYDNRQWYLSRKCDISPTPSKKPHRILVEWSNNPSSKKDENHLIIESGARHHYSEKYVSLTKEFYLRM